ncbi:uncharacterized protein LOC108916378 isoform X2 [Anoplophora glabripennis]|uniref:uncharacterized protein LOC108916378 isoform X2 n=1 Tax=Anoplophora glabripennis TaxID=217634 RepID=UPI000873D60E|nr:uncharacterized protein LOC108916378 isoform X2 [Anoplophora glabripennis]
MYSLVKFVDDGIYYITPSKSTTLIEGTLVWAPYKRMGYYEANVIATNSDKPILTQLMQKKKKEQVTNVNIEEKVNVLQMELKNKEKAQARFINQN